MAAMPAYVAIYEPELEQRRVSAEVIAVHPTFPSRQPAQERHLHQRDFDGDEFVIERGGETREAI